MPLTESVLLLASLSLSATSAQPLAGAAGETLLQDDEDEGQAGQPADIVVTGMRLPGSVIGDIQPQVQLDAGDVRALGISSVADLLTELAPQLRSGRGGSPIVLLNGQRISSHREIRRFPAEAIARVDILPEEVALKYGYPPQQKVMNIVLRDRFRAFTGDLENRFATDGGANQVEAELNFLSIRNGARFNLDAEYTRTNRLREADRGIRLATGEDTLRSLIPAQTQFTVSSTYHKPLADWISASINGDFTTDQTRALIGPSDAGTHALERSISSQTIHLGSTVNATGAAWRGTWTATYDQGADRTITERSVPDPADIARSRSDVAATDLSFNGDLYSLPAGSISLAGRIGGTVSRFRSDSERDLTPRSTRLSRTVGLGALSLDVPLVDSPSPFLGSLSANGNVEVSSLSDFGTVTTYGYGLSWQPRKSVSLIASFRDEQSAPTVQQLGNPLTVTPSVEIFDYQTGRTATVERITGGNPALLKADQQDWRVGLTLRPFSKPDIGLSVDYSRRTTNNGIIALPAATAAVMQAFPGRFVRDADGTLVQVDARPVNIARQESSEIRWGINFSKRLSTPQSQVDAMRAARQRRAAEGGERRERPAGEGGPPAGGFGRGGFGQGGMGGRINFAVYHTWHLSQTATLRDGLAPVDLIDGGTLGSGAGQPRHEVDVQAGYSRSGLGLRLNANWQGATRVVDPGGSPAANLHFSSLAKVDLRLFANLGQMPGFGLKHEWLRGTRLSVRVDNVFNQRQRVTDANGMTPLAYRPALLDPLGRTITLDLRKQF